jgi:catechol 2,3-dioxygenase-like lactoylglutathione lyase family enzyme
MSYVALATDRYDEMVAFYREKLGFSIVDRWDRRNGRGIRFDIGDMRLEVLDNERERKPLALGAPADRFHIVVEVPDIEETYHRVRADAPPPETASWGARLFQMRDPDGIPVTFLQWLKGGAGARERLRGRVFSGIGRGRYFTSLDWARAQFADRLGFDPFPGTLNLLIEDPGDFAAWIALRGTPGIRIENPNDGPNDCDARCYGVSVDGAVLGAIVYPEVQAYPESQVEVIAPVELRDALGKRDGDEVVLEIIQGAPNESETKGSVNS